MKIAAAAIVILCLLSGIVRSHDDIMKFSRPTVKGVALKQEPKWHRQIYRDQYYQFVFSNYSNGRNVPIFFAHDRVHNQWLEIMKLSTENARFGRSLDIPSDASSDFRALADVEYVPLPLKARESTMFPDRITFDSENGLYRMDCNSQLNLAMSLTSFWVRKSDLDTIR
jgi:hypothetical protein